MCLSISIGLIFVICTVFSRFWGCDILRFALVYYNNKFSELLYFSLAYSSLSSVLMPGDVYVSSCYLLSVSMSVPVKFDARSQTVPVVLVSGLEKCTFSAAILYTVRCKIERLNLGGGFKVDIVHRLSVHRYRP